MIRIRTRILAAALSLVVASSLPAASPQISLSAAVSSQRAELGQSLAYQLNISIAGQLTMQPDLVQPDFEKAGFILRSRPQQSQSTQITNGQISQQYQFKWEIAPVKSGTLTIPPSQLILNDPVKGRVAYKTKAVTVEVPKPTRAALPPTPTPLPQNQRPDEDALRPIKGDLGLPWFHLAGLFSALALVIGLALWLALKPPKPKKIAVVRDPGQVALFELEQAQRLLKDGREEDYYKECSRILREYLRHKLRPQLDSLTLADAAREAGLALKRAGGHEGALVEAERVPARLQEILYGAEAPQVSDAKLVSGGVRLVVLELENRMVAGASNQARADLLRAQNLKGKSLQMELRQILSSYLSARFGEMVRKDLSVERQHTEIRSIQNRHEAILRRKVDRAIEAMKGKEVLLVSALLGRRGFSGEATDRQWLEAATHWLERMEAPPAPKTQQKAA